MIWRKAWRDLMLNKARLLVIVGSTGAALALLGLIVGLAVVLRGEMANSHRTSNPGHINFWTSPFDEEMLDALRRVDGVADVEGQIHLTLRWRRTPDAEWRTGTLIGRSDYQKQHMDLVFLQDGRWPRPRRRELAVERQSIPYFGLTLGEPVEVEVNNQAQLVPLVGSVRMPFHFFGPAPMTGQAAFFATPRTVTWLTGIDQYNQINVQMETFDADEAILVADRVRRRLESADIIVSSQEITRPDRHWLQEQLDAAVLLLAGLSVVSLSFNVFLIYNTMSALILRETWQIGVMKTLGATGGVIARGYLAVSLLYSLLGLGIAMPVAIVGTGYLADQLMRGVMGAMGVELRIVPGALAVQFIAAVAVSLCATAIPTARGVRTSAHEAIRSHGLGRTFGQGWLERLIGHVRGLPRPLTISLRNTLRQKVRTGLSIAALALSGMMFIVVMSLSDSVTATLDASLATFGFDALLQLAKRHQATRIANIGARLPGVAAIEVWDRSQATVTNKAERPILDLWGVPSDSNMFDPTVLSGRRFTPQDRRVILVNNKTADAHNIDLGDELRLDVEGHEATWTVVGIVLGTGYRKDNFIPKAQLERETGAINRGTLIALRTTGAVGAGQLMGRYRRYQIDPVAGWNADELRYQFQAEFDLLISLLGAVALLTATVGAAVLSGSMLLSVIERRREVGVMRAIGALSRSVVSMFMAEATVIGVVSWAVAVPASLFVTRLLCDAIGMAIFSTPMVFRYSTTGAALWLLVVVVLSCLSSLFAALQARRLSVREALSYE